MVFVSGPRQAGKTTLAMQVAEGFPGAPRVNWDDLDDKKRILSDPYFYEKVDRTPGQESLVVFDEIHKHRDWKNYLKGVFDRSAKDFRFLVTGSGRLDLYQKGGDSLAGRYGLMSLLPFTSAEFVGERLAHEDFRLDPLSILPRQKAAAEAWQVLGELGPFPEPFLSGSKEAYRIWARSHEQRILREDIRDFANLRAMDQAETLFSLLPDRIGSPLSQNALAQDVGVSFTAVRSWIELFERFHLLFRLRPYEKRLARSLKKETKAYLYNHALIDDPGARFENMVALELLRAVNTWTDRGLGDYELRYVRTRDGEEVDFLITERARPFLLVEAKLAEPNPSKSLTKIQALLGIPAVQVTGRPDTCRLLRDGSHPLLVVSAWDWLSTLP
jgi:hypothetical protein